MSTPLGSAGGGDAGEASPLCPRLQVSILLQPHRTVVANFGLFRRNPWQPIAEHKGSAEPRLKDTALML